VVGHAAVQVAGRASGFHIGGNPLRRAEQGLDVQEHALLARVETAVGGELLFQVPSSALFSGRLGLTGPR